MAENRKSETASFNLGDRVRIVGFDRAVIGRVSELRGALGPGGAFVYRIRVFRKPYVSYVEVLGDQLELVPVTELGVGAKRREKALESQNGG
jgi:hypothetical protein